MSKASYLKPEPRELENLRPQRRSGNQVCKTRGSSGHGKKLGTGLHHDSRGQHLSRLLEPG